jgi:hypothetical protein
MSVMMATSTAADIVRLSFVGSIPTVSPPEAFAPLFTASITPRFLPPLRMIQPSLAMAEPKANALRMSMARAFSPAPITPITARRATRFRIRADCQWTSIVRSLIINSTDPNGEVAQAKWGADDLCNANWPLNPIPPVAKPWCNCRVALVRSLKGRQCDGAISFRPSVLLLRHGRLLSRHSSLQSG